MTVFLAEENLILMTLNKKQNNKTWLFDAFSEKAISLKSGVG